MFPMAPLLLLPWVALLVLEKELEPEVEVVPSASAENLGGEEPHVMVPAEEEEEVLHRMLLEVEAGHKPLPVAQVGGQVVACKEPLEEELHRVVAPDWEQEEERHSLAVPEGEQEGQ